MSGNSHGCIERLKREQKGTDISLASSRSTRLVIPSGHEDYQKELILRLSRLHQV